MTRFHSDQSGAAMTEFVVGLPIFILIFGGVMTLWRLNAAALDVMARAEREVWVEAIAVQTERLADPSRLSPLATTSAEVLDGADISEGLDLVSSTSLWRDSGLKAELPTTLLDSAVEPHTTLVGVTGDETLFSHRLLDDQASFERLTSGGWAAKIGGVIDLAGARPAIAAGYRYGVVGGDATTELVVGHTSVTLGARYRTTAPTFPTNRINAVALARIELATDVRYDEAIQEFNTEIKTKNGDLESEPPPCAGELAEWANCMESGTGDCGAKPSCDEEDLANPLQSIFHEACSEAKGVSGCN